MDTIASIASHSGSIGIIRLSGPDSKTILKRVFVPIMEPESHKMIYGHIANEGKIIDEVMACYMRAPKTYTREDMVEIYCHGNRIILNQILSLLLSSGARLAERGEFTRRAFVNGRIDLTQAEAIADLISSRSERELETSLKNLNGFLKEEVRRIKATILASLSGINAVFDYPEEVEDEIRGREELEALLKKLDAVISSYEAGKRIKEGVRLAIVGRPNVGKSSIMNRLLRSDRAIVTDIPGTTRDVLEDTFYIDGTPVVVMDTAGIRETEDRVERIGISLSKRAISEADIIMLVIDSSRGFEEEDKAIYNEIREKNHLMIFNKSDLKSEASEVKGLSFSAINDEISILESAIASKFPEELKSEELVINNIRHRELFQKARESIAKFLESKEPLDVASVHLAAALKSLGEIIGEVSIEDLLDNIFSNFCLGK